MQKVQMECRYSVGKMYVKVQRDVFGVKCGL